MLILALALQVTTCEPALGRTVCTTGFKGPIDYGNPAARSAPPLIIPRGGGSYKPSKRQKKAGKLVAAGQCGEAEAYALGEGDFGLASQVRMTCQLRPRQP